MREIGLTMLNIVVYNNNCLTEKCQEFFFNFYAGFRLQNFVFKRVI